MRRRHPLRMLSPFQGSALRFLFEASTELSSSLQYDATLSKVARLVVSRVADWCVIDLVEEDGGVRRLVVEHKDPEKQPLALELQQNYQVRPEHDASIAKTISTGASQLVPVVPPALIKASSRDERELALLQGLGCSSAMCVALKVRERVMGALTFVRSSGRSYGVSDLALAEEIARRASSAIENARLYREAQQIASSREEFLSIASHELRTPLTALSLQLQLALRLAQDPSADREQLVMRLSSARGQMERVSSLLDGLLDLSRLTSGHAPFSYEPLDLCAVVREVITRFEGENPQGAGLFHMTAPASIIGVWDRVRLEQITTNLLSNALKYGQNKPVSIMLSKRARFASLSIQDSGPGIAPEDQARIFQKFERANHNTQGLGLGLWLVRQIAEALGGSVRLESQLGKGSIFWVDLPLTPPKIR